MANTSKKTRELTLDEIDIALKNKSLQQQRTFWASYSAHLTAETEKEEAAAREKLAEISDFKSKTNGGKA